MARTKRISAQEAFLSDKAAFDAMLAQLQALSADHFGADPDSLDWGHVGQMRRAVFLLRQVIDAINPHPED